MGCIYMWTNQINQKRYVGKCSDNVKKRYYAHINGCGNRLLKEDIDKFGIEKFTFEVLHENVPHALLNDYEIQAIAEYNCNSKNENGWGYNLTDGGDSGFNHSEETIRKCSDGKKGERNPFYGKAHSDEWRREHSERVRGENHPMYRKKHSAESRKKMSAAQSGEKNHNYGKPMSDEQRQKRSEKLKGRVFSEETIRKNSDARRKPEYFEAKLFFFLLLPSDMPIREKHKQLYQKYPNIKQGTIRYWVRQWQSADAQNSL